MSDYIEKMGADKVMNRILGHAFIADFAIVGFVMGLRSSDEIGVQIAIILAFSVLGMFLLGALASYIVQRVEEYDVKNFNAMMIGGTHQCIVVTLICVLHFILNYLGVR